MSHWSLVLWNLHNLAKTLFDVEFKNVDPFLQFMSAFGGDVVRMFTQQIDFDYSVYMMKLDFMKCFEIITLCMTQEDKKCLLKLPYAIDEVACGLL